MLKIPVHISIGVKILTQFNSVVLESVNEEYISILEELCSKKYIRGHPFIQVKEGEWGE